MKLISKQIQTSRKPDRFFLTSACLLFVKLLLLRWFFFSEFELGGIFIDLLTALGLTCLLELLIPRRWKKRVAWPVNLLLSVMFFSAAVYHSYFGSVPTYIVLGSLGQVPEVGNVLGGLIKPVYFLFFADLAVMLVRAAFVRIGRRRSRKTLSFGGGANPRVWNEAATRMSRVVVSALLIVCLLLSGVWINRGSAISNEIVRAENIGFLNYQVSTAIENRKERDFIASTSPEEIATQVKKLQQTFPYVDHKADTSAAAGTSGQSPAHFGAAKGKNVIVVQMESFQTFPIGYKLDGTEVTPNLNKLVEESFYFPHIYQQIGQGNTSDAEFISNTSIYPTAQIAMSTGYGDRVIPSSPRLLEEKGYKTATFQVNSATFWHRNQLYPALGFQHYYDKPSYNNDHFNNFGASDEEMYRVGLEKIDEMTADGSPFYVQFVTTASHAPFDVPEEFPQIDIPDRLQGTQLGRYMNAQHYTDYALGKLIDSLKAKGLWEDTLLFVYGDHGGLSTAENDPEWVSSMLGISYEANASRFNIPLLIHVPGAEKGQKIELAGGQMDFVPTMMNLLGISLDKERYTAFGRDLLNTDRNVIGIRYYLPTGSFVGDGVLFVPGEGFDDGKAVYLDTHEPVKDLEPYREDYEYVLKLMKLSDDYVKVLPKRGLGESK
ncbi:LTA synthase family protein [Saccharibacillus alkalitolerans]|uniref:Sulfatase-like hydrolase/transferase n=1 Tax=Saccharibacillus alkalitolerans TaxID=2705290 RepID=A0ABX0F4C8_9BACL|nr:LTA synthase family protein [Saccharibacillus alkalitolerans]NGZ74764.1 sulfatase-like hydrolase/transferase [Saccharibacillus alkalitolerans]